MNLTRERQERVREYLATQGRPLETALLRYHVDGAGAADVLAALAAYQNEDGGFGHAIEPDLRLPGSSVIATTVGLQVLREIGEDAGEPLVQGAMRYLADTYDAAAKAWPITPPAVNDYPHAPWWHRGDDVVDAWGGYLLNPRAAIVGYLLDYPDLAPPGLGAELLDAVLIHLDTRNDEMEMHDLLCCMLLAETTSLPPETRGRIVSKLCQAAHATVCKDPAKWEGYGLTPLTAAPHRDSPLAGPLAEAIEANLDFEIDHQQPDGSWLPNWNWGDAYPDAWPEARQDATSIVTLRTFGQLRSFGRLE